jgi:putative transcriptional regulator
MRNRLRVLRAEKGWSQADLAKLTGVSRQAINAVETGKYDPSLPLAFKIAAVFEHTIEELFYPDADGSQGPGRGRPPAGTRPNA